MAIRALSLLLLVVLVPAQEPTFPLAAKRRDADVPTPKSILGHALGDRAVSTEAALRYARAVAVASDRVVYAPMGETWTGLPMAKVVITSAARHRADPAQARARRDRRRVIDGEIAALPKDHAVSVWFCMSIHGNEASGVDAGLALLYHLASSQDAEVTRILDHVVLSIDLVSNPDGRERFVQGVRDRRSSRHVTDGAAWDHDEPWPGGRTNHYLFDMNRDWFLQTQVESRIRAREFLGENPQVFCDFHEMGRDRTYYFSAPPGQPTNSHISPSVRDNWKIIGKSIGDRFDENAWPYWVGDMFPADYPGYGGSWPCLHGAAGFTFEQAGAGAGHIERRDGSVLTYLESTTRHTGSGYAVLTACATEREAVLDNWSDHFRQVREQGAADDRSWFVFTPRHDPDRLARLRETLEDNGIRTRTLAVATQMEVTPLVGGSTTTRTLAAGSLVVSSRQGRRPLVLALLDPKTGPEPGFVSADAERIASGARSEIYDVTAWNLPLLFGVEGFRGTMLPEGTRTIAAPAGAAEPAPMTGASAWLASGRRLGTGRLLGQLLDADVRVRVVPFGFTAEGRTYGSGTLLVLADRNRDPKQRAAILGAKGLTGVRSLRTSDGHDLGSGRIVPVRRPSVVVATGEGTSGYSTGAVWWLFERITDLPHLRVGLSDLPRALEKANVLVLPDGRYGDRLKKATIESFLAGGGTVVALRGATNVLVGQGLLPLKPKKDTDAIGSVAGVIMKTRLDRDHWLAHGLGADPTVQVRTDRYWETPAKKDARVVLSVQPDAGANLSGILTDAQGQAIRGTPLVIERTVGRGRIIAFTEDPVFRGTSPGVWTLFLNAVLLGASQGS